MRTLTTMQQSLGLAGWFALTFAASALGAIASVQAQPFYAQLTQPDWAPPAWVFGPVWTTLYAMMALAAWMVWRLGGFNAQRRALTLFLLQLLCNTLWSWIFFSWNLGLLALIDIGLLWILIAATLVSFWQVQPLAGILMLPYLAWVSFAAVLNFSLWHLNPALLG